jgi:mannose-6-phosphate isomerase-like protein (cupin superfamily)
MKSSKLKLTVAIICLATFMANVTYGQSGGDKKSAGPLLQKTGNPADWPKDQDAVIAAGKNHKILLENDSVRVLEVTVLPGEKEAVHHHQWPSVLYVMEGEAFIDRDGEGNVMFDSRKIPSPVKLPFTTWNGPQAPHSIENVSKTQVIRLIRVEIKK